MEKNCNLKQHFFAFDFTPPNKILLKWKRIVEKIRNSFRSAYLKSKKFSPKVFKTLFPIFIYIVRRWNTMPNNKRFPADTSLDYPTFLNDKKIDETLYSYL